MHTFVTIAAMIAIFAAHVLMMVELRPRGGDTSQDNTTAELGETS
jgi:hypothetical protein